MGKKEPGNKAIRVKKMMPDKVNKWNKRGPMTSKEQELRYYLTYSDTVFDVRFALLLPIS